MAAEAACCPGDAQLKTQSSLNCRSGHGAACYQLCLPVCIRQKLFSHSVWPAAAIHYLRQVQAAHQPQEWLQLMLQQLV